MTDHFNTPPDDLAADLAYKHMLVAEREIAAKQISRIHAAWEKALADALPDLVLARRYIKRDVMRRLMTGNDA